MSTDPAKQLIESYYAVARHLEDQARHKQEVANMLFGMADAMSEARMREKQPSESGTVTRT